jgi:hypothetical protein
VETKRVKVVTSTGKVHYADTGMWKNGNVDPLCNYMSWRGDYYGQPWKEAKDQNIEVTCKNCLKAAGEIPQANAPKRLTVGMRCRIKPSSSWYNDAETEINEVLLEKRSQDTFSFLGLGQKELKKEDPQTCTGGGAWIHENDLEWINSDFETNLEFMDWYQEHEDEFCGDCGAWFPDNGRSEEIDGRWENVRCPNDKCPGNKHADGCCPWCDPNVKLNDDDICPECGWGESDMY